MVRGAYERLRARGVSNDVLDETGLRSSLDGMPLPEADRTILEAKIRLLARRMRRPQDGAEGSADPGEGSGGSPPKTPPSGVIHQASHVSGDICICMASRMPGTTQSLAGFNPPLTTPGNPRPIGVFFQVDTILGRLASGDGLRLIVEDGAPLGANQMLVGLASAVAWAKEIYSWNLCRGRLASVHQSGPNMTPSFMLLERGCDGAHTLVFTKPQLGGIWADVANFDPSLFWSVFGGRRLTFTWMVD